MQIGFRHVATGRVKRVNIGWSWSLFLTAGFFGVPLFRRGLITWGWVFLMVSLTDLLLPLAVQGDTTALADVMEVASLGLAFWIGLTGNEMTARGLLARGWQITEPESARYAAQQWGLPT